MAVISAPGAAPETPPLTENLAVSPTDSRQSGCCSSMASPQGHAVPAKLSLSLLAEQQLLVALAVGLMPQRLQVGHSQALHTLVLHMGLTGCTQDRLHKRELEWVLVLALGGRREAHTPGCCSSHTGWVLQGVGNCCTHHTALVEVADTDNEGTGAGNHREEPLDCHGEPLHMQMQPGAQVGTE